MMILNLLEETFFKIVFSEPSEMDLFKLWIERNGGVYDNNKEESWQQGKMPKAVDKLFQDEKAGAIS